MGIFIISMGVSSVMSWLGFGLVPPDGFGDDDDDALDVGAGVVVAPMTITLDLGLVASVSVLIPLAALAGRSLQRHLPYVQERKGSIPGSEDCRRIK